MSVRFARLPLWALPVTVLLAMSAAAQTLPTAGQPGIAPLPPAHGRAAHTHHARARHRLAAQTSAGPPPARPMPAVASGTSPAPVPNESVSPPGQPAPTTEVAPSVFQLHYPPVGEGYVTGSSPGAMDDRNAAKATGVQMKVPLPQ